MAIIKNLPTLKSFTKLTFGRKHVIPAGRVVLDETPLTWALREGEEQGLGSPHKILESAQNRIIVPRPQPGQPIGTARIGAWNLTSRCLIPPQSKVGCCGRVPQNYSSQSNFLNKSMSPCQACLDVLVKQAVVHEVLPAGAHTVAVSADLVIKKLADETPISSYGQVPALMSSAHWLLCRATAEVVLDDKAAEELREYFVSLLDEPYEELDPARAYVVGIIADGLGVDPQKVTF